MTRQKKFAYMSMIDEMPEGLQLSAAPPRFNFGIGHNDPSHVPVKRLSELAGHVLRRSGEGLASYFPEGGALGVKPLRQFIARHLREDRGASVNIDQVLVTSGSLQGIDLVNDLFTQSKSTVICEEFTYVGALARLHRRGVTTVGTRLDDSGIIPEALDAVLTDLRGRGVQPSYLYAMPTVQNPTGTVMPLERRLELLDVTSKHGLPILEDECYSDVVWRAEQPPCLFALDPTQVIYIGSCSKSLAPALRVGYLVALPDILARIAACKNDGGTGAIEQMLVAEYFGDHFHGHVRELSDGLELKADTMIAAVRKAFGKDVQVRKPEGGIYIWVKLPDEVDASVFVQPAVERGVTFNPGAAWACDPQAGKSYIRLCFAYPTIKEIKEGIAILGDIFARRNAVYANVHDID